MLLTVDAFVLLRYRYDTGLARHVRVALETTLVIDSLLEAARKLPAPRQEIQADNSTPPFAADSNPQQLSTLIV